MSHEALLQGPENISPGQQHLHNACRALQSQGGNMQDSSMTLHDE